MFKIVRRYLRLGVFRYSRPNNFPTLTVLASISTQISRSAPPDSFTVHKRSSTITSSTYLFPSRSRGLFAVGFRFETNVYNDTRLNRTLQVFSSIRISKCEKYTFAGAFYFPDVPVESVHVSSSIADRFRRVRFVRSLRTNNIRRTLYQNSSTLSFGRTVVTSIWIITFNSRPFCYTFRR